MRRERLFPLMLRGEADSPQASPTPKPVLLSPKAPLVDAAGGSGAGTWEPVWAGMSQGVSAPLSVGHVAG